MNKSQGRTAAKILIGVLLLVSVTIWNYQETVNHEFVWDSYHYLVKNVWYISHLTIDNTIWMFLSLEPYWHPLTWFSWAIDYQLYGGLDSAGFHLTNNILHAANSALLFVLMLVIFGLNSQHSDGYPFRTDNHAIIAAFLCSLIFAVHPQHVESVAWVAERKDLLCQLFLMLSTLTYVKYVTCSGHRRKSWFHATLGLFTLALLSKPMAVTFPVVLLLLDVYPLQRTRVIQPVMGSVLQQPWNVLIREKLPFFGLSFLLVLITLFAHVNTVDSISFGLRLLNACNSILFYLYKLVAPLSFAPLYSYLVEPGETITWGALLPLAGVLGLSIASIVAWTRGRHVWLIAWLIYLVTLSPVLGLVQSGEQGAADRFAYLPTLPVYILIGAGILVGLNKASRLKKVILLIASSLLVLILAHKTTQQIGIWKDSHTLWSYAVESNPRNVTAQYNLAISYFRQENYEQAALHFDKSVTLPSNPTSAVMAFPTLAYRGLTYIHLGRYDEALRDYLDVVQALETSPGLNLDQDCIYFNTGWLYARLNLIENAQLAFGKVDSGSSLAPGAQSWLKSIRRVTGSTKSDAALAGFCTTVLASEAGVMVENQVDLNQ